MPNLRRYGVLAAGALACAALAAACGDGESLGDRAAAAAAAQGEATGARIADQAAAELVGQPPRTAAGGLAALMLALDDGEQAQARIELARGADPDVIAFGTRMLDEHAAHAMQVRDALEARRATLISSAASTALRAEAAAGGEELERAPAGDVDFTYLRQQVMMHAAGEVLLERMIPRAPDPGFADFLDATRAVVAEHRDRADALLREF